MVGWFYDMSTFNRSFNVKFFSLSFFFFIFTSNYSFKKIRIIILDNYSFGKL